ncbi:inositol monophosphatase family protein [Saccharopolyspora spinosa]|uniref:inositol-phosphate phosphatase n=1 Tax=Saccharopolyspora spinosa TaxID=60894 RepID=A0A2N3Y5H6_SACSN|nr:inositol monophosphatase family protein [Saccharopolyspora spinosa]PKW18091.1 myo-inositol-1(or 4)-monophosphatase [Saccharopolyspora spinosa]
MTGINELLTIANEAVNLGHQLLTTTPPGEIHAKGDRDLVTDLDIQVQHEVRAYLEHAALDIDFLGEEQGGGSLDQAAERIWALDPIDGTSNFARSLPLCGVSLALVERGTPIIAVISAPFLGLRYNAVQGQGAFVNGQRIHASRTTELSKSIVSIGDYAVGAGAAEKNRVRFALTQALAENVERVRMFGSAALDLVWAAEGRTDACILLSNKPWDTAAGVLVAREAGASVTDAAGTSHTFGARETIAAAPGITDALLRLISDARS